MSSKKKKRRIVRYRSPININIGLILFIAIFLYVAVNCFIYMTREKISVYEVVAGESESIPGIATTGIALRSEKVVTIPSTGYVNFYVKDGSRVSVGETVYTIDESGSFSELLKDAALNSTTLTSDNIVEIKRDIFSFISSFDDKDFDSAYEFKYDLNATLIECINLNALDKINQSLLENGNNTLSLNTAVDSGIIEFYTDGFEGLVPEQLNNDIFNIGNYSKNTIEKDKPVEAGKPVYKTITDETWYIAVPLTDSQFEKYENKDTVEVVFPTENIKTSAYFTRVTNDNQHYGLLELKRYMIRFADKRFLNVQIIGDTSTGLKIPKTSVVEKEFFTVPRNYITQGGNSEDYGVMKEVIDDAGNTSEVFTRVDIIEQTEDTCYIEGGDSVESGTVIVQPQSTNRYQIANTVKLSGVYNVNTGLASFRYIKILSEKNGYYIVESGNKYGLQVYDQIVLNASLVKENQVIFK